VAITGLAADEASGLLEAAGGDLETAVALFFASGDGCTAPPSGGSVLPFEPPAYYSMVWQDPASPVPEAWADQSLAFTSGLELPQLKNGPCGVLAAFQAAVVACLLSSNGSVAPDQTPTDQELAGAVMDMLLQAVREGSDVRLVSWQDASQPCQAVTEQLVPADRETLAPNVLNWLPSLFAPGGAVLLLYALVATRGVDQLRQDMSAETGMVEGSLVTGPMNLCSMELVSLLLIGEARANVTAYHQVTRAKTSWPRGLGVGMLSLTEKDTGQPLADGLKSPALPVWVLHGGDHFTTLFAGSVDAAATLGCGGQEAGEAPSGAAAGSSTEAATLLYHWNGLPPAGPRLARIPLVTPKGATGPAPETMQETFYKPVPGEIDDVVQANADDKKNHPNRWTNWRFEVVLAVDDPDVQGAERPPGAPLPPTFEQGPPPPPDQPWRCSKCYATRFKTFNFGMNEPGATTCAACGASQVEAGWSLWLHYDELPGSWQARVTNRHGPKILTLLRTKWPGATSPELTSDPDSAPMV